MARHLVTSALPYANGPIHFGHVTGAYLPADLHVRALRQRGEEVLYVCGADEHGVAITIGAEKDKVPYAEYVARWRDEIKRVFDAFDIRFDVWSGTSICAEHAATSQEFFRELDAKGHLQVRQTEQLYCEHDRMFLADRYIVGTCHECGFEEARGDECPKCGQWLDPLRMPKSACKVCGNAPVRRSTTHWYLDLPRLRDAGLGRWFAEHAWKPNVRSFVGNMIEELQPRPITRDMSWGVPVPADLARGETGKVLYVWFDAPIGYISFTKEWARLQGRPDDWKRWWQDADTRLVHFIGKDNIPFHTVVFPAMLFGMGAPWILPADVPANEFYNLQGGKFSTSKGWTVPVDEFTAKFDAQAARFHLAASMPENSDSEWRFEDFQTTNNSLLADVVGNLAQRVLRFLEKNFDGRVPEVPADMVEELDRAMLEECGAFGDPIEELVRTRFRRATETFIQNGRVANVYIDRLAPWSLKKTDPARCGAVLATACEWLVWMARWMAPFMPAKAQALWEQLGLEGRADAVMPQALPKKGAWRSLKPGAKLGTPAGLFPKIEDAAIAAEVEALKARAHAAH